MEEIQLPPVFGKEEHVVNLIIFLVYKFILEEIL